MLLNIKHLVLLFCFAACYSFGADEYSTDLEKIKEFRNLLGDMRFDDDARECTLKCKDEANSEQCFSLCYKEKEAKRKNTVYIGREKPDKEKE